MTSRVVIRILCQHNTVSKGMLLQTEYYGNTTFTSVLFVGNSHCLQSIAENSRIVLTLKKEEAT